MLDPRAMPELAGKAGHDIVTSSGDTLLGADDKAGVAEIMAAVAHLAAHPELPRPTLRVGFTPDEEIGEGATLFDVERFGAALRLHARRLRPSASCRTRRSPAPRRSSTIHGVDVHPGFATGKLVNAARLAGRVLAALPADAHAGDDRRAARASSTSTRSRRRPGEAVIRAIVRDFDDDLLERARRAAARDRRGGRRRRAARAARGRRAPPVPEHAHATSSRFPEVVEAAEQAIRAEGIEPLRTPIRGGTDGSLLSAMGLPTPNLFTGGHEYHSVREWASVQDMAAAAATVVRLAEVWARR